MRVLIGILSTVCGQIVKITNGQVCYQVLPFLFVPQFWLASDIRSLLGVGNQAEPGADHQAACSHAGLCLARNAEIVHRAMPGLRLGPNNAVTSCYVHELVNISSRWTVLAVDIRTFVIVNRSYYATRSPADSRVHHRALSLLHYCFCCCFALFSTLSYYMVLTLHCGRIV